MGRAAWNLEKRCRLCQRVWHLQLETHTGRGCIGWKKIKQKAETEKQTTTKQAPKKHKTKKEGWLKRGRCRHRRRRRCRACQEFNMR